MALKVIRTPQFRQGASELVVALGQSQEVRIRRLGFRQRVDKTTMLHHVSARISLTPPLSCVYVACLHSVDDLESHPHIAGNSREISYFHHHHFQGCLFRIQPRTPSVTQPFTCTIHPSLLVLVLSGVWCRGRSCLEGHTGPQGAGYP